MGFLMLGVRSHINTIFRSNRKHQALTTHTRAHTHVHYPENVLRCHWSTAQPPTLSWSSSQSRMAKYGTRASPLRTTRRHREIENTRLRASLHRLRVESREHDTQNKRKITTNVSHRRDEGQTETCPEQKMKHARTGVFWSRSAFSTQTTRHTGPTRYRGTREIRF